MTKISCNKCYQVVNGNYLKKHLTTKKCEYNILAQELRNRKMYPVLFWYFYGRLEQISDIEKFRNELPNFAIELEQHPVQLTNGINKREYLRINTYYLPEYLNFIFLKYVPHSGMAILDSIYFKRVFAILKKIDSDAEIRNTSKSLCLLGGYAALENYYKSLQWNNI